MANALLAALRRNSVPCHAVQWAAGEIVFAAGEPAHCLFVVQSGCVRLYRTASTGKEAVVRWCAAGDVFGEDCLSHSTRTDFAEAVTASSGWRIASDALKGAMAKDPAVAEALLHAVTAALQTAELVAATLAAEEIPERLRRLTQWLWGRNGVLRQDGLLLLPFTHAQLASLIGTSRECVTVHLKALQDSGALVTKRGSVAVRPEWVTTVPTAADRVAEGLP